MIQGQQAAQQPRETEQIIGTLTGIVTKGPDKWQAVVMPDGSQYTKNLWTKDQALVGSLATMIGTRLAFACNVSHWQMQDGTPVRSLWIDAAGYPSADSQAMQGPPYVEQAQQAQQSMLQPSQGGYVDQSTAAPMAAQAPAPQQSAYDQKEDRIHRQTASKVAAILLSNLPSEQRTLDTLLTLSERLVSYYDHGLARTLDDEIRRATPQTVEEMIANDPGSQYTGDDDIPF